MSKNKMTKSASSITETWASRTKGSVSAIQAGVNAVTESPMEKAAAKKEKMKNNLMESINNGSWEKGLRKVSLADWKAKTSSKVAARLSSGVDNAMSKRTAFDQWMVNTMNSALGEISSMPDMTLEDNLNKAVAMMRYMSEHKYKTS